MAPLQANYPIRTLDKFFDLKEFKAISCGRSIVEKEKFDFSNGFWFLLFIQIKKQFRVIKFGLKLYRISCKNLITLFLRRTQEVAYTNIMSARQISIHFKLKVSKYLFCITPACSVTKVWRARARASKVFRVRSYGAHTYLDSKYRSEVSSRLC